MFLVLLILQGARSKYFSSYLVDFMKFITDSIVSFLTSLPEIGEKVFPILE